MKVYRGIELSNGKRSEGVVSYFGQARPASVQIHKKLPPLKKANPERPESIRIALEDPAFQSLHLRLEGDDDRLVQQRPMELENKQRGQREYPLRVRIQKSQELLRRSQVEVSARRREKRYWLHQEAQDDVLGEVPLFVRSRHEQKRLLRLQEVLEQVAHECARRG